MVNPITHDDIDHIVGQVKEYIEEIWDKAAEKQVEMYTGVKENLVELRQVMEEVKVAAVASSVSHKKTFDQPKVEVL